MGLLRRLLWPHRRKEDEDGDEAKARSWKRSKGVDHPGVYRIEIDGEGRHMRSEGPPFSFWGSSRIILILSFLLWWIQPAGPMIAGFVGGRRAGSPMKAVVAAILPVAAIFVANSAYAHTAASGQIDFVASLPQAVGDGAASILPFLSPYKDFLIAYMSGFVKALQSTFGMGTNGYLMVIIFAYIGGLVAEQTRRELYFRNGASQSVGLNLVQPILGGRHRNEDLEYVEEDEELREMRHPVRAHARSSRDFRGSRRRRGAPDRFDDFREVYAETSEGHATRRSAHPRERDDDEEDEGPSRHATHDRRGAHRARARGAEADDEEEEDPEAVARREAKEAHKPRLRTREEEIALQRFVERALKNYEHS